MESALGHALSLEPANRDFFYAAADHYLQRGFLNKAEEKTRQILRHHPSDKRGRKFLATIALALKIHTDQP